MGLLKDEDILLILSDHGFGTVRKTFYMNVWLREKGFLVSRRQWAGSKENLDMGLFHRKKEPSIIQKIKGVWGKKRSEIHWGKTQAYFINTGYGYGIRINLAGREPEGIVKPEEYHDLRNQIIEKLNLIMDEEEGSRIIERVHPREDVYRGPYTKNAPDVIFIPDGEYTLNDRMKDKIFKRSKAGQSSHRPEGILILQGPGIKKGERITGAHIMDVAPTILYLLGLPVSKGFDGKVLTEALEPDILKTRPIRVEDIPLEVQGTDFKMTETEEEEIKKKLRGLGYMG
jgi:predicted AlkP superfamily phosphohydrolase/phosphomutase